MGNILILISCSHDKNSENGEFTTENFISSISENREKFLEKRRNIKDWIQKGWVVDKESGENRDTRRENTELIDGPDFGQDVQEKRYLPAYKRYEGRFFSQLDEKDWHTAKEKGYHILIISGLYGLLSFNDSIQAYNCHLTDRIIGDIMEHEGTLSDYWVDTLTEGLKEYIEKNNIDMIIDLISEESYQHSIKWEEEIEKKQLRILHRVFEKEVGPRSYFLPNLGRFFKNDIINKSPEEIRKIKVSRLGDLHFIERDYFKGNDRIIFESKLYELGFDDVAREIDQNIERLIKLRFGNYWDLLTEGEQYYVMDGKKIFEDFKKGKFNTNVSSVHSFWTATESVRNRFLGKLFNLFYSCGYNEVIIPAKKEPIRLKKESGNLKFHPGLGAFETELLMSYCKNPEKIPMGLKDKLKVTVGNMRNFIKDHSIFSLFDKYGPIFTQRDLRNKLKGGLTKPEEVKEKVEEFHNLFFNKEKSILIAYLKLIHAIPK